VGPAAAVPGCPFVPGQHWLVGTVGRLQTVKNQPLLARAFVRLLREHPEMAERARLVIVGEGPLRGEIESTLVAAGLQGHAWLPGARDDVADVLRSLDLFVLPSQAEGTSCTLQEAMSSGLPVVATAVGGTPDLVEEGATGHLVPSDNEAALAGAIHRVFCNKLEAQRFAHTARARAINQFGLDAMVRAYESLFSGPQRAAQWQAAH